MDYGRFRNQNAFGYFLPSNNHHYFDATKSTIKEQVNVLVKQGWLIICQELRNGWLVISIKLGDIMRTVNEKNVKENIDFIKH